MKQIATILLFAGIMIVLNGCAKTYTTDITFDQFAFTINNEDLTLEETTEEQKEIFEKEDNLYKIYIAKNQSGFSDSLLISREENSTQIPLERVMQINIKKLESRLKGFDTDDASQVDIKCSKTRLTGYLQSFSFDSMTPKKTVYMNQYFFRNKDALYIISSATEESAHNKGFKKGLKNIQCL